MTDHPRTNDTYPTFLTEERKQIFLIAEDNPADIILFSDMLDVSFAQHNGKYELDCVNSYGDLIKALEDKHYDALILDMDLPDQFGLDTIEKINASYHSLPIVVLTGYEDIEISVKALKKGAQDYLLKNNVSAEVLFRSLRYAKERKVSEHKIKAALAESASKNLLLENQAKNDFLTKIPNRAYFHEVASNTLFRADRCEKRVALLYFDLNGFKKINDTYGHLSGDDLLRQVASRLKGVVRDTDVLARLGGDEFVILTDLLESKHGVLPLIHRIKEVFDQVFILGKHEVPVNTSIGVAFYPDAGSLDLLIKQADCAMYKAKKARHTFVNFFSDSLEAQYARQQTIERMLADGLETNQITADFQPLFNFKNPNIICVEALARWNHSSLGKLSPEEFISIAESTPAISGVTRSVVLESANFYRKIKAFDANIGKININICPSQLSSKHFVSMFLHWLDELDIAHEHICLELTERQVIENISECRTQFSILEKHGISLALDDFGSGFSSLSNLLNLPISSLKIAKNLISHIDCHERNQAIVAGVIEMAHRLSMEVVAEGIETAQEFDTVKKLGCDYGQGFLIAQPLSLDNSVAYYAIKNRLPRVFDDSNKEMSSIRKRFVEKLYK